MEPVRRPPPPLPHRVSKHTLPLTSSLAAPVAPSQATFDDLPAPRRPIPPALTPPALKETRQQPRIQIHQPSAAIAPDAAPANLSASLEFDLPIPTDFERPLSLPPIAIDLSPPLLVQLTEPLSLDSQPPETELTKVMVRSAPTTTPTPTTSPIAESTLPAAPSTSTEVTASMVGASAKRWFRRWQIRLLLAAPCLLLAVGVALGASRWGLFGRYALEALLPAAGDAATARRTVHRARLLATEDRYDQVQTSLRQLARARHGAGLNHRLLAASLLQERWAAARFGVDGRQLGRIAALQSRLQQRQLEWTGSVAAPWQSLLLGEQGLERGQWSAAQRAFARAARQGGGASALWGVARAQLASGDAQAAAAVAATLQASPRHIGARLVQAVWATQHGDAAMAVQQLRRMAQPAAAEDTAIVAPSERALAQLMLGYVHAGRQRYLAARLAFEAVQRTPSLAPAAAVGAGHVLLEEHRPSEALARFEAAASSLAAAASAADRTPAWALALLPTTHEARRQPLPLRAQLGTVRAKIELNSLDQAQALLEPLLRAYGKQAEVHFWVGRLAELRGDTPAAENAFRQAMQLDVGLVAAHLSAARLLRSSGRGSAAAALLHRAQAEIPDSVGKWQQLAADQLQRGATPEAIRFYQRALALDEHDLQAAFGLTVALRRAGRFAEASRSLAKVEAGDADFPGLALERGHLLEQQGRSQQALAAYEAALAQRPHDPDLLLRLAAVLIELGRSEKAASTLMKLPVNQAMTAEAEYIRGRIEYSGGDTREAMARLRHAIELDAGYGPYHLHFGRAALAAGELSQALQAAQTAMQHPDSQLEGHALLGQVHSRTGAARDALLEFRRVLELDPQRLDMHAHIAAAFEQLGDRREAVRAYRQALADDPPRGDWWVRLARLQVGMEQRSDAELSLRKAIDLGQPLPSPPLWLADAHRLLGDFDRLAHRRAAAVQNYRRYLEIVGESAVDRRDVQRWLAEMGGM